MPLLSIRGYARHKGVTHVAVLKAIKVGRITLRADGKIDSAKADRQWAANTDPSKPRNAITGDPKHRRKPGSPSTPMALGSAAGAGDGGGVGADREALLASYQTSRSIRENYEARMAKLRFEREDGLLVPLAEVKAQAFAMGRTMREKFMAIPERLSPVIAMKDRDECYRLLSEELRAALEELGGVKKAT